MTKYELIDKKGDWYRYKYYPEDGEDFGIVAVNVASKVGIIETLAKTDTLNRFSSENINYVEASSYAWTAITHILDKIDDKKADDIPEKNEGFNHFEFLKLCNNYPVDLNKVDEMLRNEIDFSKVCFGRNSDFLSELMENIEAGENRAHYLNGDEDTDDKYLYEILKRIFAKGYRFPKGDTETLEECLMLLYYSNRDLYLPEILKLFLDNGADIDYIINDNDLSEEKDFTLAQVSENIGCFENSLFEDSMWNTVYEIITAACNLQPYADIHSLDFCLGLEIEEIYVGRGLKAHSKTDNFCVDEERLQYRIKFTNGQQLVVNYLPEIYMNPYDETYRYGTICKLTGDYKNRKVVRVRTFMQPNRMGRWHLCNVWLYLENGFILKFCDIEDTENGDNLMLICDKEDNE